MMKKVLNKKKTEKKTVKPKPAKSIAAKKSTAKKPGVKKIVDKPIKAEEKKVKKPILSKTKSPKPVKKVAKKIEKKTEKKPLHSAAGKKIVRASTKPEIINSVPEVSAAVMAERKKNNPIRYGQEDLEQFRQIIVSKQKEIIDQLQNLKDQMLDPTTGEYINENSPYSLHMAEQGTDAMEREKTFLYAQRENKFLGYLEDALKRIDAGTYGICIECIDDPKYLCETCPLIPKARLDAVPHSQLCVQIKMKQEKPRRF